MQTTKTLAILTTAVLLSIPLQAQSTTNTVEVVTAEQAVGNAVQQSNSPSFTLMDGASSAAFANFMSFGSAKGLQFKDPVVSPGFSYRSYDDGALGGFGGNEVGADLSFDFDIYDGLVTGFYYQHLYRGGETSFGTSEHLESDGVSFYAAKRFFDLLNVGVAYNFADTRHRLSRAVVANLDRDSNGFTILAGTSDRIKKISWNLTTSFGFVHDDYTQQKDLETGRFTWGGAMFYDLTKWCMVGGAYSYNNFVFQEAFPNTSIRDDDYWTVGPRLRFFPTDDVTVNVEFDTQEGFINYSAYTARLGLDIAF